MWNLKCEETSLIWMTSTSTVSQTYKSVGALRLVIQHGAFEESCLPFIVNWDLSPPVLTSRKRRKHITFLLHTQETYSPQIVNMPGDFLRNHLSCYWKILRYVFITSFLLILISHNQNIKPIASLQRHHLTLDALEAPADSWFVGSTSQQTSIRPWFGVATSGATRTHAHTDRQTDR